MIKEDFGMLSVIICEDEPIQTTLLVKLVQQWADQCALPVQILSYPNAESFLFSYEEQPFGDILLAAAWMRSSPISIWRTSRAARAMRWTRCII